MHSNINQSHNKGFTTIELVTTFALTMVIVVLLMQIIVVLKDIYVSRVVTNNLMVKQGLMTEKIMDDFDNKTVIATSPCANTNNCIEFIFDDATVKKLKVTSNTLSYGGYTTRLTSGTSFGTINVESMTTFEQNNNSEKNDSYLRIQIPVKSNLISGDYGVNIVYQYNRGTQAIHGTDFSPGTVTPATMENKLFLLGVDEMTLSINPGQNLYKEAGWFVKEGDVTTLNDSSVKVTQDGVFTDKGTVTLTYTYQSSDGNTYTRQRKVNIVIPGLREWTDTDVADANTTNPDYHYSAYRNKIKQVIFETTNVVGNNLSAAVDTTTHNKTYWDVSYMQDGSIMAWLYYN